MLSRNLFGNNVAKKLITRRFNATVAESVVADENLKLTPEELAQMGASKPLMSLVNPATHTLVSTRSFPSLEPNSIIPVPARSLLLPLRKDTLFNAKYFEENSLKIKSIVLGRSQWKFSRKKLAPQKHTGRARVGDGNSPIRLKGASAFGRTTADNPFTEMNLTEYQKAFNTAMSHQYKMGKLFVIGENYGDVDAQYSEVPKNDAIDFNTIPKALRYEEISEEENYLLILNKFVKAHDVEVLPKVLFVTRDKKTLLERSIDLVVAEKKKEERQRINKQRVLQGLKANTDEQFDKIDEIKKNDNKPYIKSSFKEKTPMKKRVLPSVGNMSVVNVEELTVTNLLEADRVYMDLESFEFVVTTNIVNLTM